MTHSTATRRLVKSPPELWAELGSEDSLGRHLAEFGEIRITRTKPQTTVAWEGDRASGTVELVPTGWGTKVMLTATPAPAPRADSPAAAKASVKAPAPTPSAPAARSPAAGSPDAGAAPAAIVAAPRIVRRPQPDPPAPIAAAPRIVRRPQPDPPAPPPEVQRGFFARLFRKRQPAPSTVATASEPVSATQAPPTVPASSIPGPPAPTPDPAPPAPAPNPAPIPPPAPDPVPPTPAPQPPPPPQIEILDPDRTTAILTAVLDDLGAAHHRPFSRD
jgi:hypothetical protein